MFESPRRGRQASNFTTNVPKILDLKSSSEQIFFRKLRWVPLIILLGKSVSSKKTQLSSRRLRKPIWPRFPIHRHKKHKATKNSFHYIFKEYHGSDPQLCHGSLGSQMIQWNKNVFKPILEIKGCTFCAYSSNPGNGYSNRGVNKRGGGRGETQKNGSKY